MKRVKGCCDRRHASCLHETRHRQGQPVLVAVPAPLESISFAKKKTRLECPFFLFNGRHDYSTSHQVAAEWFANVSAPTKKMFWFDDSAHMMMQEQPGLFLMHLVNDVRPLAVRAGDAPPNEISSKR